MKTEQIVMCVVALALGMLVANMLTNVCGCKTRTEGFSFPPNFDFTTVPALNDPAIANCAPDVNLCNADIPPPPNRYNWIRTGGNLEGPRLPACTGAVASTIGSIIDGNQLRPLCEAVVPPTPSCAQCVYSSQGGGPGECTNPDPTFNCNGCHGCPERAKVGDSCPQGFTPTNLTYGRCPLPSKPPNSGS